MISRVLWAFTVVAACSLGLAVSGMAQEGCSVTTIPPRDPKLDIFNSQQEMDLGDAIAEQVQREYLVIDDEDVTGYVQKIGAKLLAQAPPTDLKIQFFLFDLPIANALTLPGGRIYISRKLIATTRNEDELASVMGHELGHALTHQTAMEMTRLWREALGLTEAGTREEIFRQYEILQEMAVQKRKAFEHLGGEEKQDQLIADQVGLQLITKAGYAPHAFPDFFDRTANTKGKTGNWLSDMFGATHADARRLREMQKQVAAVTASCKAAATTTSNSEDFRKWQAVVVSYSGLGHKEQLHELFGKTKLNPPLQSDIRFLRFSPDGKHILAQDESMIYVMTREPLAAKFSIYAPDAYAAMFTADSQSILFYTDTLRVESWSVADEVRTSTTEMVITSGCVQSELSPDGKLLACLSPEFELGLYDVATGEQRFSKKNFMQLTYIQYFVMEIGRRLGLEDFEFAHMHFSPNGRYFVAHGTPDSTVALELEGFRTFSLPGAVRGLLWGSFAFVGTDRIAGSDLVNPKSSGVVKFPSGEEVRTMQFGNAHLRAATDGRHLSVYPIKDHALGVVDLQTGTFVLGSDKRAFDAYNDIYVYERLDGDIGINTLKDAKEITKAKLPVGQLGHLRAAAVSPNLRWLAISERSRGGLWDLIQNQRVFYTRGFSSAAVSTDGIVDADINKFEDTKRQMARMEPATRRIDQGKEIGDHEIWQFGTVMLRILRKGKDDWKLRNITIEAQEVESNRVLWTRDFPKEGPRFLSARVEGNMVLAWTANSDGAKQEIKNNPALSEHGNRLEGTAYDYFLEVVEPRTGKVVDATVIRTGKRAFHLESAESSGDWLVAADSTNRLLVYSLTSGEETGILFGRRPVISAGNSLLAAENERGQLTLYDLKSLARRQQYFFTSRIAFTYFAPDNRRFLVLTGDQTAYFLAVPTGGGGK